MDENKTVAPRINLISWDDSIRNYTLIYYSGSESELSILATKKGTFLELCRYA